MPVQYTIPQYIMFFFFYSFVGWICECTYCSYINKKWTNRGFLFGPICPIYGAGALAMLFTLTWCVKNPFITIVLGMIVCDVVEYITSFLMEKLFHARWWDYSDRKFNINGRICLHHTFFWALGAAGFMYVIDPFIGRKILTAIPEKYHIYILIVILSIFGIDFIMAVKNAIDIKKIVDGWKTFLAGVKKIPETIGEFNLKKGDVNTFRTNLEKRLNEREKKKNRMFTNYKFIEQGKKTLSEAESFLNEVKDHFNDNEML